MSDCKQFNEFCSLVGNDAANEILERICNALWSGKGDGITMLNIYEHDACNHTISGNIEVSGNKFGFIVDSGNWNGTVVKEWGEAEDIGVYKAPKKTMYTFAPINDELKTEKPHIYKAYLAWKNTDWFKEKERGYNYDRHFAPGSKTENYYRKFAESKGMKIVPIQESA